MRGGYVHTTVLLDPLKALCRAWGIPYREEVPVGPGRAAGHIDLVIGDGAFRVAVEAECSSRRVVSDFAKARALEVQELWIVVPSPAVCRGVERALASELRKNERFDRNLTPSATSKRLRVPELRTGIREAVIGDVGVKVGTDAGVDVGVPGVGVFVLFVFQARARLERVGEMFSVDFRGEGPG